MRTRKKKPPNSECIFTPTYAVGDIVWWEVAKNKQLRGEILARDAVNPYIEAYCYKIRDLRNGIVHLHVRPGDIKGMVAPDSLIRDYLRYLEGKDGSSGSQDRSNP